MPSRLLYNALIRTHHITSQKKIAKLRTAAHKNDVVVILKTSGVPGIMYAEGSLDGIAAWVDNVKKLRYKDFQLIARPAPYQPSELSSDTSSVQHQPSEVSSDGTGLHHPFSEVSSGVQLLTTGKDFAQAMQQRGLLTWWRQKMGYDQS